MLWLWIFACTCTAGRASRIQLSIISPAPCVEKSGGGSTCCTYQALPDERLYFDAASRAENPTDIDLALYKDGDITAIASCRSHVCQVAWNSSDVTADASGIAKYSITASPYNARIGSETKVVCVEIRKSVQLTFSVYPRTTIVSEDGNVTVVYSATGYPEPARYILHCGGRPTQESVHGSFLLVGLPDGEVQCQATAVSRLSQVNAPATIVVTRQQQTDKSAISQSEVLKQRAHEPYSAEATTSQKFVDNGPTLAVICALGVAAIISLVVIVVLALRRSPGPSTTIVNEQNHQHVVIVQSGNVCTSSTSGCLPRK